MRESGTLFSCFFSRRVPIKVQEKIPRTLWAIHWHLPGRVASQYFLYNNTFSQCDMICWFCSDLGRQVLVYCCFAVCSKHSSQECPDGRLQKNCEMNCYNREVPDVLGTGWILLSLPVSCPFCERRTLSLLDLSFLCSLITNIDIID